MEETLKQILSEIQKVNQRMDGLDKRFDSLNKDIKELKDGQEQPNGSTINHVVAKHIDERFDELKDTLEEQHRVIDTLLVRSVKNESEVKDFKRIIKNQ
ncbi:hypothetical protein FH966_10085 [Lentibacillus cibarius]|uniref:Uncharacterized protein n=1 Tax=Lentibacillus cibarius TaxID=2583219 RepID=A0A549YJE9_9BACI|nr:hypothetical protein [Lentibacillus cibarius]TRM12007.1 hypothetical protein FH966_10085 [Lentibacillus cibarius]